MILAENLHKLTEWCNHSVNIFSQTGRFFLHNSYSK